MTLQAEGLTKAFDDRVAVDDVSFSIAPGETYGLLGPNGAGKTTTISIICGLLEPDRGTVEVAGLPMTTSAVEARSHIGYVPQEIAIYPDLSAVENLRFFGRLQGLSGRELSGRIDEVLEVLGLTDRAKDRTEEYSGGMQRRLNIGLGLLHRPDLLVLDEPTVGVDPQSRNAILDSVESLSAEGLALLYTTHYMEEAERLCDRVGIMDGGELIAEGTRRELIGRIGELDRIHLELADGSEAGLDLAPLRSVAGVDRVTNDDRRADVYVDRASTRLTGVLEAVAAAGAMVRSVEVAEPDLEAVFLHLTGRALRDG
jgi:ABC-2 type transport system ATP-binding protein